jgi:hypothetical protein
MRPAEGSTPRMQARVMCTRRVCVCVCVCEHRAAGGGGWTNLQQGQSMARVARAPAESIDLWRFGALSSMRSVSLSIAQVTLGREPCVAPAVFGRCPRGECCSRAAVPKCCSRACCACRSCRIAAIFRFMAVDACLSPLPATRHSSGTLQDNSSVVDHHGLRRYQRSKKR